jgi:ubiquitin-conjugating enzyme E2 M
VCLNILRDEWKPVFDINTVIYGVIYLFYEPNANDPLNHEAAALLRSDKASFERNVYSSLRGGRIGSTTFPRLVG